MIMTASTRIEIDISLEPGEWVMENTSVPTSIVHYRTWWTVGKQYEKIGWSREGTASVVGQFGDGKWQSAHWAREVKGFGGVLTGVPADVRKALDSLITRTGQVVRP
jgi:hypothetical protein